MKKLFLLLVCYVIFQSSSIAQQKYSMLGLSTSYDYFEARTSYSQDKYINGVTLGLEYSEQNGAFGFRAGISYSRIKDYIPYINQNLTLIDIFILPEEGPISVIDFPISGQIYLGKKKLKLYLNAGLSTTLTQIKDLSNTDNRFVSYNYDIFKSLSFRGLLGGGITYQISDHFGLDLGYMNRSKLHTLNNHFLSPTNSFGTQMKINYIF